MCDRTDLYKDIVKHLRVVRNVSLAHKKALNLKEIEPDNMTPYERGRMTRSCIRLGYHLETLFVDESQKKIVFAFLTYLDGIGVQGSQFSKGGIMSWNKLWQSGEDFIINSDFKCSDFQNMITHVANMIDSPLSEVPRRVLLLKLSV
jgi:hypothetical protein